MSATAIGLPPHRGASRVAARAARLPRGRAWTMIGQLVGGVLIAAAVAVLTVLLVKVTMLKAISVVVVVLGSLWFACTRRTQLALAALMLYLGLLDGYLKLATGSNYVTFVRDALLYALAIGLLLRATVHQRRLAAPPLSGWVLAFVVLVLVQLANPLNGSLYHSLAGVRQHLEFVPLFFLTFAFVRTTRALRAFVAIMVLIAAVNGPVNWVQFNDSPTQFAAWGPGYSQRILGTGNFSLSGRTFYSTTTGQQHTRPFGLGSDSGSGGIFAAFAFGGIIAFVSLPKRRHYLAFAAVAAVGASVAVVTSQARSALVASLAVALGYGILTARSRGRIASLLGLAVAGLIAFVIVSAIVSSSGAAAFRYSGLNASGLLRTANKARGRSLADLPHNLAHYPLGAGLAVAGPASGVRGGSELAGNVDAENELSFASLETGVPGMVVLVGFTVYLFVLGLRRCRNEPDPEARVLLAAIIAPVAGMLTLYWVSAITPTTPAGPYLWAVGGIISYWLIVRPEELRGAAGASPLASV